MQKKHCLLYQKRIQYNLFAFQLLKQTTERRVINVQTIYIKMSRRKTNKQSKNFISTLTNLKRTWNDEKWWLRFEWFQMRRKWWLPSEWFEVLPPTWKGWQNCDDMIDWKWNQSNRIYNLISDTELLLVDFDGFQLFFI